MCVVTIGQSLRDPETSDPPALNYDLSVGPHRLLRPYDYYIQLDETTSVKHGDEDISGVSERPLGLLLMTADQIDREPQTTHVAHPSFPCAQGSQLTPLFHRLDHEEGYPCPLVEFTKEKRGQVRRVGLITLLSWPCSRGPFDAERSSAYVQQPVCNVLNAQFMSPVVPEDCYEEVDEYLRYTVTLV
ncbi:hypothetical protein LTS10_010792 [Elasticomyces elasticus]|nr:hypothetical protein LTS10_010792 [Elasticomyces elasticus]